jgi:hypothetical protein
MEKPTMAPKKKPRSISIQEATAHYEVWLRKHIAVLEDDLQAKHVAMAADPFSFLRATYYRWAQLFPELCAKAASAPVVFSVGDLHVENFGTWHDAEGRMIWGVNDFDEVYDLPYTNDLVRLAASALLAVRLGHLELEQRDACAALLSGYAKGLESKGRPFVLSERHEWLHATVTSRQRSPARFWAKLATLPTLEKISPEVLKLLEGALPGQGVTYRVAHRQAGLGSLGRERFTVMAVWAGGSIAREAKPLLPSACVWALGLRDKPIRYAQMLQAAVRAPDPFLSVQGHWVLRRLAPYCSRIELAQLPQKKEELKLLRAMGRELANIHWGTPAAIPNVLRDLKKRKPKWLAEAAQTMVEATLRDWKDWRKAWRQAAQPSVEA